MANELQKDCEDSSKVFHSDGFASRVFAFLEILKWESVNVLLRNKIITINTHRPIVDNLSESLTSPN
jgi:hypothetical protein